MDAVGHRNRDVATRRFAVSGLVVGTVALIGLDLAHAAKSSARPHKPTFVMVRVMATAQAAALPAGPQFAASILALALMLWLGRQSPASAPDITPSSTHTAIIDASGEAALPQKSSISYHIGGLYGP